MYLEIAGIVLAAIALLVLTKLVKRNSDSTLPPSVRDELKRFDERIQKLRTDNGAQTFGKKGTRNV